MALFTAKSLVFLLLGFQYGERARGKPELMDITSPETGGVTLEIAFEMEPEVTWAKPYQSLKVRLKHLFVVVV